MNDTNTTTAGSGRFECSVDGHHGGEPVGLILALAAGRWAGRQVFASGGKDGAVRLWDAATGRPAGPALTGHTGAVHHAAFAGPENDVLVTTSLEKDEVLRWSLHDGVPRPERIGRTERVQAVGVADLDGRAVVGVATRDGALRFFDARTGAPHAEMHLGAGADLHHCDIGVLDGRLVALTVAQDPAVATSCALPLATMWDVASGTPLYKPWRVTEEVSWTGHLVTVDGRLIAVVGKDVSEEYDLDAEDDDDEEDDDAEDNWPYNSEYFLEEIYHFRLVDVAENAEVTFCAVGEPVDAAAAGSVVVVGTNATDIAVLYAGRVEKPEESGEFRYFRHGAPMTAVAAAEVDGRTIIASADEGGGILFWDLHAPDPARIDTALRQY